MRSDSQLVRGIRLRSAVLLNLIDMVGVGPFITLPLIIAAMGGPQAMLGWIFGAFFAMCDGLVWSELAASMPEAGGSYFYLKEIYGPRKFGRLVSFLFIWQLTFSAPLSIASGAIGLASYSSYIFPALKPITTVETFSLPLLGQFHFGAVAGLSTLVAIGVIAITVALLYRGINGVAKLSALLSVGVIVAISAVILTGLTHFNPSLAFSFPPHAFAPSRAFLTGLGAAMLIATYDYWGYYNICYLGAEVEHPERNLPRGVLISIAIVAIMYIVMNVSVMGIVPWQELMQSAHSDSRLYVISAMMQRVYGAWAARAITLLIAWTAFASVFSLLLGYSRVPYAAALDGNYFAVFARLHPKLRIPHVSLIVLAVVAMAFCFLSLADVIPALVVIRLLLQFLLQAVGLILLRARRPEMPRPFRMWLYPLPALLATAGFVYVLFSRPDFFREIRYALVLLVVGVVIYFVRALTRKEWPFAIA